MSHSFQTVSVGAFRMEACFPIETRAWAVRGRDERFDGWCFTGTGRLVEVDGAIFFDPLPEGAPHPAFDGQPEPRSSCAVPCTPPASLPLGVPLTGQGEWTGTTWILDRWTLLPGLVLPWSRPADPTTPWLPDDETTRVLSSIPDDLKDERCEVGLRSAPERRGLARLVLGIAVFTPPWQDWLSGPGSVATLHATLHGTRKR